MANKNYTVVDLFCGAGGLSRGFLDAGFNVVLGVDFDDDIIQDLYEFLLRDQSPLIEFAEGDLFVIDCICCLIQIT